MAKKKYVIAFGSMPLAAGGTHCILTQGFGSAQPRDSKGGWLDRVLRFRHGCLLVPRGGEPGNYLLWGLLKYNVPVRYTTNLCSHHTQTASDATKKTL